MKEELKKIETAKERDDYFKFGGPPAILWQIGKAAEAETIAALWSGDVALDGQLQATSSSRPSRPRNPRPAVLPMLVAILRDKQGKLLACPTNNRKTVEWPFPTSSSGGAFGSKGSPALRRFPRVEGRDLAGDGDLLLARAQEWSYRADSRAGQSTAAARSVTRPSRRLGVFGCPQDFDFLVEGLNSHDPADAWNFAYALYEYGDLRAVPRLAASLATDDEPLSRRSSPAWATCRRPRGSKRSTAAANRPRRRNSERPARRLSRRDEAARLTYAGYAAKAPDEKARLLRELRERMKAKYGLRPGDRTLTHDELLKAAAVWTKQGFTDVEYGWVGSGQVMAAATAADIPLLLDVAAGCYGRFTDESLDEALARADRHALDACATAPSRASVKRLSANRQ